MTSETLLLIIFGSALLCYLVVDAYKIAAQLTASYIGGGENNNLNNKSFNIIGIMTCLFNSLGIVIFVDYVIKNIEFFHKILWLPIFSLIVGHISFFKEYFVTVYVLFLIYFFRLIKTCKNMSYANITSSNRRSF